METCIGKNSDKDPPNDLSTDMASPSGAPGLLVAGKRGFHCGTESGPEIFPQGPLKFSATDIVRHLLSIPEVVSSFSR